VRWQEPRHQLWLLWEVSITPPNTFHTTHTNGSMLIFACWIVIVGHDSNTGSAEFVHKLGCVPTGTCVTHCSPCSLITQHPKASGQSFFGISNKIYGVHQSVVLWSHSIGMLASAVRLAEALGYIPFHTNSPGHHYSANMF